MANEIELWVFDMEFNRLAVIDTYIEVKSNTYYHKHSDLSVTIEGTKENIDLFLSDSDRIIVKSNDIHRGYYVETSQYTDEKKVDLELFCHSLSIMTAWRIVKGQQRYTGNIEDVIKSFINKNAINTTSYREIPYLVLGANQGIAKSADETFTNTQLDEAIWEMCNKSDVSFEILMNYEAKKYVANIFIGIDRSTRQTVNPHVVFSKEFENVNKQSYTSDKADYKSTAYVEGAGNYVHNYGLVVTINNQVSGFARRELYVDATNIKSTYYHEGIGTELTIPENEYAETISEKGKSKLAENPRVRTFESKVDTTLQYKFSADYFIGDVVTNRNDELGISNHSRIVTAKEVWNRNGYSLSLEFGTSIPKLLDKIKREVRR